ILTYGVDVEAYELELPVLDLSDSSLYVGDESDLPIVNTAEDSLYLLYTSGTTGQPKGVIGLHQGTVNLIYSLQKNYPIDGQAKILQKTAYTFDVSIADIFRWGLMGAQAYVLASGDEKEPAKMCEAIERYQLTEMQIAPSVLKVFLAHVSANPLKYGAMLKSLRYVFAAGEALPVNCVKSFYELIGAQNREVKLINAYGPTETSVFATCFDCEPGTEIVLIGKPIENYQAYILNDMVLCGVGMIGELCIAGVGVTKGYLNSEALTNEKFIDNPYGRGKLYRTGDAARWQADGNIEYLGRIDDQVKIRGFRIELGEIESALRQLIGINDAVAVVQSNDDGDKVLCAYVLSVVEIDAEQIKMRLRSNLPEYMVPTHFMKMESFPVTSSGKLDKKALPKIEIAVTKEYVAPNTETEETIVHIFEKMFDMELIGIKESFFDLGGNSLKATLLVNQIEQATGVRLGIKDIFQGVTAEGIALALADHEGSYEPIPQADDKAYYPISPSQKLYFLSAHLWDYNRVDMTNNIPSAFKVKGTFDVEKAENAFEALLARHEILRTSFHLIDNETVAKIHDSVTMDMTFEENDAEENIEVLARNFVRPFDLTQAPLMRARVIKTGEADYVLFMDCHHIISDGMSSELLLAEFITLYADGILPPVKLQYRDYSEWVLHRALDDQKNYWMSHFDHGVPRLQLPEDFPRPSEKKFSGDVVVQTLDQKLSDKVMKISQKMDMTEFMAWLSMMMLVLENYSNQGVVLGTPVSGRTHRDTEDILGVFINRLLLSGKPEKEKTLTEFLQEVKENCLMAYENQDYPFESLAQQFEPMAHLDKSKTPLYDVQYLFYKDEGGLQNEIQIDGTHFQAVEIAFTDESAKFDLVCKVTERNGAYTVTFKYCSDLFKRETIEKMVDQLIQILDQLDETSDQTIEMLTQQI
ncbi:MAG: condensation domain-containing protein, partial [Oscillospiraceae bacterium]|nr:condensation domain-containing protein [Oscillospiraceae bacterium]